MTHKPIIFCICSYFSCYKLLTILNRKGNTYSSGHIQKDPPFSSGPPCPGPGALGDRKRGMGPLLVSSLLTCSGEASHNHDPSKYDTPLSHLDGPPSSQRRHPLQAHRSQSAVFLGGNWGGGGGGMTHGRGGIKQGGEERGQGWGTMCASEVLCLSSSHKK
jgi:hypothetical protein